MTAINIISLYTSKQGTRLRKLGECIPLQLRFFKFKQRKSKFYERHIISACNSMRNYDIFVHSQNTSNYGDKSLRTLESLTWTGS